EGLGRLGDQFAKGRRARRLSEDEDLVDRETTHGLGRPVHERGHGQEIACMAIPELVTQLARGVEGIEGCDDAAERRDGVEGDRVLGQVRTEDGEDVTLLEPSASQRAGDPVHAVGQGAVGQLPGLSCGWTTRRSCANRWQRGTGNAPTLPACKQALEIPIIGPPTPTIPVRRPGRPCVGNRSWWNWTNP